LVLRENSGAFEPDGIAMVGYWLEVSESQLSLLPQVRLLH